MILKIATISLVSAILWLHGANGASYSKVFVQSGGPDVVPVEYFNYGAPAVISNPQIARLSAPPVGSVVPVQTVSNVIPPCVSPCVIPGPSITAAAPSAKFITYNSPNVPVVVAPNKDNAYEYSYVVYDENTGDRKAQRELSDGAVVRGEYSFLQPDGYVREVQYRADDLTGFNVVVKRILPETVGEHKKPEHSDAVPCPIKHEELKVEVVPEKENHSHEHEGHDHGLEDDGHSHENHDHGHEGHGHNGHSHDDHDYGHEGHGNEGHSHDDHDHGHEGHGHSNEDHGHEHVEPTHQEHGVDAPTHEAVHVIEHIEVHEPEKESVHEQEHVHEPEPEHKEPHQPEHEHASEAELEPEHASQQITEAVHVEPLEVHDETPVVTHQAMVEVVDPLHEESAPNLVVSYEEVLRCLQAKGEAHKGFNFSPLTYIILPASNRPC